MLTIWKYSVKSIKSCLIGKKECNGSKALLIEVDFLISNESKLNFKIFPLEVKSSKNYTTSSLNVFKDKFGNKIDTSYIIHPKNLSIEGNLVKIPPYMFGCVF